MTRGHTFFLFFSFFFLFRIVVSPDSTKSLLSEAQKQREKKKRRAVTVTKKKEQARGVAASESPFFPLFLLTGSKAPLMGSSASRWPPSSCLINPLSPVSSPVGISQFSSQAQCSLWPSPGSHVSSGLTTEAVSSTTTSSIAA